jgi:hypothetical protein
MADRDDGYVTQAELLTFLGLLMGYHYLPELSLYWAQDPDLGLGIVQQSMTRDRFKFISKHVAITSPEDLSISNEERGKPDPLAYRRCLSTTSIFVLKIVDRHPENRASTREWSGSRATVR